MQSIASITRFTWFIFASLVYGCLQVNHVYAAPKLAIEQFSKESNTKQIEISPDGQHIAIVFIRDNKNVLSIMRLSDRKIIKTIKVFGSTKQIGQIVWANNKRVLYNVLTSGAWNKSRYFSGELYGVGIDGSKHFALLGHPIKQERSLKLGKYGHHSLVDLMPEDEKHILVAFYPWRVGLHYYRIDQNAKPWVYKLNIYTGLIRKVVQLPTPFANAITDNDHQIRLSFGSHKNNNVDLQYRQNNSATWQPLKLKGLNNIERIESVKFSQDNNKIYLTIDHNSGPRALYLYDLANQQAEKIFQHEIADFNKLIFDRDKQNVVAVSVEVDYPRYYMLESQDQIAKQLTTLLKQMQGYNIDFASVSKDGKRIIVKIYADYQPTTYYLYDAKTKQIEFLIASRDWIDPDQMASKQPVKFQRKDGQLITGYITKPLGKTQSLPTVVMPQSFPHTAKVNWQFEPQVQLLANQGYAVLQVNVRGTNGFGYEFEQAGYGQWNGIMLDDLTFATQQLIDQGVIDKNRLCIYGRLAGGYTALIATIKQPTMFRCAISSGGLYSLPLIFKGSRFEQNAKYISYMKKVLNYQNPNDTAKLKQSSPAYNTAKINTPLLLIHGGKDYQAPIEHLELLEQGLKANNKPYEKLLLDHEGHHFYEQNSRSKVYRKIIEFLDKHIGP